ncbi:hypothetical protein DFH08DRAFT_950089 [Mycena albidolilacea]|uniref:Uncharacterized protein n=1 Tax=Mycena albidolilacea TaxID=1033008 RepID=A0AAD7F1R3_9AGAR|nr:hypothetical protein DFH08DRAFT_950089 [Mycena albidolilacea]
MVRVAVSISFLVVSCGARGALTSSTTNTALSLLPDFIHEVFVQLTLINDTVFEAALNNFYSLDLQASDVVTSLNLTHAAFGELVQGLCTELSERQLIEENFVDGQQVVVTIASLLHIKWIQDEAYNQEGHREVVTEVLITNGVAYQSDEA